ncbi:type I restriction-modification system subunit M N-terminal domain-containing protein [Paraburkholderia sp. SIMBA_027]|uniref:type I restriction-modification system subunit M N-terminal domain-containing protein n=1 Tax=Paraburkholderia sp. SIMBA_027 TaxID=3085770 RepID=UPI00397B1C5F
MKKSLWATTYKLRANMGPAEYKRIVPGLIFLKYIPNTFSARNTEPSHACAGLVNGSYILGSNSR